MVRFSKKGLHQIRKIVISSQYQKPQKLLRSHCWKLTRHCERYERVVRIPVQKFSEPYHLDHVMVNLRLSDSSSKDSDEICV